jgi:hypothetical protein
LRVVRACWLATAAVLQPCVMPCHKAQREQWRSTLRVCSSPGPLQPASRTQPADCSAVQQQAAGCACAARRAGGNTRRGTLGRKSRVPVLRRLPAAGHSRWQLHMRHGASSSTAGRAGPHVGVVPALRAAPTLEALHSKATAGAKQRHGHVQEKTSALAAPMKPCSAEQKEGGEVET